MKYVLIFAFTFFLLALTGCDANKEKKSETTLPKTSIHLEGSELKVVAEIYLKPDATKAMRPVFEKVIAGSQAEEGCLYYDLHRDVTDTTDTKYTMLEIWKDQAAIDTHNGSMHFKNFARVAKDYIDSMKITTLKIDK